ncbi:MAG: sigma 54-interacting transcriptional regulator [Deltaproteobacteria bacterium]|nr:sigma 54-interacting transcriptional regulator [Deltaproteobacteria bacterium]
MANDDETHTTYRTPAPLISTRRRLGALTLRVLDTGRTVSVARDRIIVGRSKTANLVLDHPSVSAAHLELCVRDHGVEIRDLGSTNGVRIGPVVLRSAVITPGTVISVGDCDVRLESANEVEVEVSTDECLGDMIGGSLAMREVFAKIRKIAQTPLDVLVVGETGTGKELACRAIHSLSDRRSRPLVTLDCGTLVRSLTEAAFFGYRKGAFTGADQDRPGYFEDADGGVLFIDEIGELPLDMQVKLLRALDRREVIRVGETQARTVDVRIVAATNRDLQRMVADGLFREDLYFRLSRARIELPPLRRRGNDVVRLARWFVAQVARHRHVRLTLADGAAEVLLRHPWPGNVRELANAMQYAAHTAEGEVVGVEDLVLGAPLSPAEIDRLCLLPYKAAHSELDRVYLARAMREAKGSRSACSRNVGISRTTLRRRLEALKIPSVD